MYMNDRAKHKMETWVHGHRRQKWRLAGSLARQTDDRWSKTVLDWTPNSLSGAKVAPIQDGKTPLSDMQAETGEK